MIALATLLFLIVSACAACSPADDACTPETPATRLVSVGTVDTRDDFQFRPIVADAPVDLVFGSQAAWMLVLALEVDGLAAAESARPRVTMTLTQMPEGEVLSAIHRTPFPLEQHDGRTFVMGPFLPLSASDPVLREFDWAGANARLITRLEPACSDPMEIAVDLRLELQH